MLQVHISTMFEATGVTLMRNNRHLKPGGKIEIAEGRTRFFCNDDTFPETCYTHKWLVRSLFSWVLHHRCRSPGPIEMSPKFSKLIITSIRLNSWGPPKRLGSSSILSRRCQVGWRRFLSSMYRNILASSHLDRGQRTST